MRPHEKLLRFWNDKRMRAPLRHPDEAAVAMLEQRYCVTLPADFRDYLLLASPLDDDDMDANDTILWSTDRIKNMPDEYPHKIANTAVSAASRDYLFFADYMIWCSAWAINCGQGKDRGRIVSIGGGAHDPFVADSFAEFVDRYLKDADRLAFPKP